MPDPNLICDLHHRSWQRWILNPLSKARDQTCNLMVPSWIHFRCAMKGTPCFILICTEQGWRWCREDGRYHGHSFSPCPSPPPYLLLLKSNHSLKVRLVTWPFSEPHMGAHWRDFWESFSFLIEQ